MEDTEYLALSQLFDSIGIIEKGIEKIYHYLLINKRIENLKEVCTNFNLTLKRGYKICSVLNDLELVQIYDRPMKIHIATPLIPLWQTIINNRIEALQEQFIEKKDKCEVSLEDFLKNYDLKIEVTPQEPVEFVSFNSVEDLYYPYLGQGICRTAIGIKYSNPFIQFLQTNLEGTKSVEERLRIATDMRKLAMRLEKVEIQVIFHEELLKDLLLSEDFTLMSQHVKKIESMLNIGDIEIHITKEEFSNFSLTDSALVQPSFDPSNKLIGYYISRNNNIYQIFSDKFNELYDSGILIDEFIKNDKDIKIQSLTKYELFALCIL